MFRVTVGITFCREAGPRRLIVESYPLITAGLVKA